LPSSPLASLAWTCRWCWARWSARTRTAQASPACSLHVAVALTLLVPLLAGVHPAWRRVGRAQIDRGAGQPPSLLALSYGSQTPTVAVVAH